MFQPICNAHLVIFNLMLSILSISVFANDQMPTFNFKSKYTSQPLRLIVTTKDKQQHTVTMSIKNSNTKKNNITEKSYTTSTSIELKPNDEISLYDLHNIDFIEIYYDRTQGAYKVGYTRGGMGHSLLGTRKDNTPWMVRYKFANIKEDTTIYVKFKLAEAEETPDYWLPVLEVQEGRKGKTTDGYSLRNNITKNDITKAFDQAKE